MTRGWTLVRSRRARQDLIEIWNHVAADDPAAADRLLDRLDAACSSLVEFPYLGPNRDDIRPGLRYLVNGHYLILYRVIAHRIEIVRIVHGRRDLPNVL